MPDQAEPYADFVAQLEDAVLALWDELPVEQVKLLAREAPRLVDFIQHLHEHMSHEEKMVRRNVWSEPDVLEKPCVCGAPKASEPHDHDGQADG